MTEGRNPTNIDPGSEKSRSHQDRNTSNENDDIGARRFVPAPPLPFKRTIRRPELRKIVPLADTTIYELEKRGEFPKRFFLTPRCVVWDLSEIEAWITNRRRASENASLQRARNPDVRQRRTRPVK